MNETINARNWFFTCWVEDISQQKILDILVDPLLFKVSKLCIGEIEETENEKLHFHVYAKFQNPIRLSTIKNRIGCKSIHLEKAYSSIRACYDYITKEGLFYCNFDPNDFYYDSSSSDNDVYSAMIRDILVDELELYDVLLKYGKIALLNISKLKELMQIKFHKEAHESLEKLTSEFFGEKLNEYHS